MNIIYSITILAICILFMLIHKSEKKQNIIGWIAITSIVILCYNVFICVIYTFIGILCTLQNLSICNAIVILILAAILLKQKKIQKYYLKVFDIVFTIILLAIVVFIAYKQYGFPFRIKYEITDGSTHYFYAEEFYKSSTLLYKIESNEIFGLYDSDFRLPGAYVNEGILFKIFEGTIANTDLFVLFDLFDLYLSGILFYYLLNVWAKENKKLKIIAVIFSILYMLGYPLNSMIYGFVYLTLSLNIIIAFLLVMSLYEKNEELNSVALPILALLSFGIFFSYAYFIPIIYIAVIINIILQSVKRQQKVISEDNLIKLLFLIINPLILGLTYFVILPSAKGIDSEISTLIIEGILYQNYITNLLAFVPILIAGIVYRVASYIKKKKTETNLSTILLILAIAFTIILFAGKELNLVSAYYCFKAYFIIWPLVIHNAYIVLSNVIKDEKKVFRVSAYIYVAIYVIAILVATLIGRTSIGINDIFYHNEQRISEPRDLLTSKELEILKEVKKSLKITDTYILGSKYEGRLQWMTVLYDKNKIYSDIIFGEEENIEEWLEEEKHKYYVAYYADYEMIEEEELNLDYNSDKYEIIYENEDGFILERK